jgi:hypothetical protein
MSVVLYLVKIVLYFKNFEIFIEINKFFGKKFEVLGSSPIQSSNFFTFSVLFY